MSRSWIQRLFVSLIVATGAGASVPGGLQTPAQGPAAEAIPEVRLETHEEKSTFYLGEPIQLDLLFANRTGAAWKVNSVDYGDLSEKVEITPDTGWFQWQGQSAHDYAALTELDTAPVAMPLQLDEGFVFREPGSYRVRVTTTRLVRGDGLTGPPLAAITTNEVTIELRAMPAEVEMARLQEVRAALASAGAGQAGYATRQRVMRDLAALQGEDALTEKIRLLEAGNEDFRSVHREAFATTRDLARQLALLEAAWTDPKLTPEYNTTDAMEETRLLMAGRHLRGWQMMTEPRKPDAVEERLLREDRADMSALLASMPARQGESRTMAAYYLLEFGGLTEEQRARAVDYAVEEFPRMDDVAQHMLLETVRPPLRDARLLPPLQAMLARDPADKDVVATLLAMEPADAAKLIVTAVCAPKGVVLLDTFKQVALDRVAAVDTCLAPLLRQAPDDPGEFAWDQRAVEAARFATVAVVPAVLEGWKGPRQDNAVLAVLLRDDPHRAVALLKEKVAAGKFDGMLFYETSTVYTQLKQAFPEEVLTWLRAELQNGTDKSAGIAAYVLTLGGESTDGVRVEHRLEALRTRWQNKELTSEARQAEIELVSALSPRGVRFNVDQARWSQLGQGCMSKECRSYFQ